MTKKETLSYKRRLSIYNPFLSIIVLYTQNQLIIFEVYLLALYLHKFHFQLTKNRLKECTNCQLSSLLKYFFEHGSQHIKTLSSNLNVNHVIIISFSHPYLFSYQIYFYQSSFFGIVTKDFYCSMSFLSTFRSNIKKFARICLLDLISIYPVLFVTKVWT